MPNIRVYATNGSFRFVVSRRVLWFFTLRVAWGEGYSTASEAEFAARRKLGRYERNPARSG